jgi:hypothetical protein
MTTSLAHDPIELARRHWAQRGWSAAADGMALVTSIMRVQQELLARVDHELRQFDLTFARYEVLMLLEFSRHGRLPLGKIGERLQVHPASVTNVVQRLTDERLLRRVPNPEDGRSVRPTMSGIPLDAGLRPDDGEFPGQYPYTRGRTRRCTGRSCGRCGCSPGSAPPRTRTGGSRRSSRSGGDGLSTAFDMPTLLGLDSDDPMSLGEVGRCGVAIDSLADMEDLYAGIDLGEITTSMTINSPAAPIFAMFVAQAENAGVHRSRLWAARCRTTS